MQKTLLLLFLLPGMHLLRAQESKKPAQDEHTRIKGDTIYIPGRILELDQMGFPVKIRISFTFDGKDTITVPAQLLAEGIHFHFTRQSDGKDIRISPRELAFTGHRSHLVRWHATGISPELKIKLQASLRSKGILSYKITLTALQDLELKEITMHIPFEKAIAKEIRGLTGIYPPGRGRLFPPDSIYSWKWDKEIKDQITVWIGTNYVGLLYELHGREWSNGGKGGINVGIKGKSFLANNYSGAHSLKKGETLKYDFDLMITPLYDEGGWEPHLSQR